MTPKEKAIELVSKYCIKVEVSFIEHSIPTLVNASMRYSSAKECALIAVNEIIASIPTKPSNAKMERLDAIMFWIEVKQEIEKL